MSWPRGANTIWADQRLTERSRYGPGGRIWHGSVRGWLGETRMAPVQACCDWPSQILWSCQGVELGGIEPPSTTPSTEFLRAQVVRTEVLVTNRGWPVPEGSGPIHHLVAQGATRKATR